MGSVAVPSYTWYKYPVPCWCFWTFKVNRADPLQTFEFLEIYLPSLFLDCLCNHLVQLLFSYWVVSDSFVTLWTVACQAPLSMGFPRQEYWNGSPFVSPGDLPNPGTEPRSGLLHLLHWQADPLCCSHLGTIAFNSYNNPIKYNRFHLS